MLYVAQRGAGWLGSQSLCGLAKPVAVSQCGVATQMETDSVRVCSPCVAVCPLASFLSYPSDISGRLGLRAAAGVTTFCSFARGRRTPPKTTRRPWQHRTSYLSLSRDVGLAESPPRSAFVSGTGMRDRVATREPYDPAVEGNTSWWACVGTRGHGQEKN